MNEVSQAIYQQLGGRRFTTMTGSKPLTYSDKSLSFKLPRNNSQANRLTITLTSMDLYDVVFYRVVGTKEPKEIDRTNGAYPDMLQNLFTGTTGLYITL